jgi:catechol 2,3-dioxygenase-like lactoylglutathione lyase family enzyme
MVDHVGISVGDIEGAKRFYAEALAPLGYSLVMEGEGWAGFAGGDPPIPDFFLNERGEGSAAHFALRAPDRSTVDRFHAAALAAGGTDNGAPGIRAHYHVNYYGAYVHDADGNNIEAVCHNPE